MGLSSVTVRVTSEKLNMLLDSLVVCLQRQDRCLLMVLNEAGVDVANILWLS